MKHAWWVSGIMVVLLSGGFLTGKDLKEVAPPVRGRATLPANYKRLGLTDDQREKILSIRGHYNGQIDELVKQIRNLRNKEKGEMEAVLTEAQKARLREILTEKGPQETKPGTPEKPPQEKRPPERKPPTEGNKP